LQIGTFFSFSETIAIMGASLQPLLIGTEAAVEWVWSNSACACDKSRRVSIAALTGELDATRKLYWEALRLTG
jgi:hypothetical protein